MIFTSYTYLVFLAAVFVLYWSVPASSRKLLLVIASYVFYCTWKWQFGFLLLGVSLFNWSYARWVLKRRESMSALVLGIVVNLASLIYFKYAYFLLWNLHALSHALGWNWRSPVLSIILPLGISFFTFQGIAYLFDVAAGEEPIENLLDFLLFKAFWPQLIAGPIVRLSEMRDQILFPRSLDYGDIAYGCQRILFGFFKKMVLADNLAPAVEMVFFSGSAPNAVDAICAMLGFGMQIYFDFGAYSDIAIGTARLFGFRFPENFNWPYLARSPREFWNRWHMTLSRWIRDYLFTPLSFASRRRPALAPLWLLVAMALCGLWHGAAWTFVLWGIWHGLLLILNTQTKGLFPKSADEDPDVPPWHAVLGMALTFTLVSLGWLLFRASSLEQAVMMVHSIVTFRGGLRPSILRENAVLMVAVFFVGLMLAQVILGAASRLKAALARDQRWATLDWSLRMLRPVVYAILIVIIIVADQEAQSFVYFQF